MAAAAAVCLHIMYAALVFSDASDRPNRRCAARECPRAHANKQRTSAAILRRSEDEGLDK